MATIFRKTDKGYEEVSTRRHNLPVRMRSALILVDGRRTDEELLKLVPGGAGELLQDLQAQGFIEAIAVTDDRLPALRATDAPAAAAATAAATAGNALRTLPDVQRRAVRFLTDQMGPSAEYLCQRIEAAKTAEALNGLLARARDILRDARGADVAERFQREFLSG